jgi:hypothetical protein
MPDAMIRYTDSPQLSLAQGETPAQEARHTVLPKPRPSVTKRQREQKKRDKQVEKDQRRALRKTAATEDDGAVSNRNSGLAE